MTASGRPNRFLKSIATRHDDVAVVGRRLFLKPVHHLVRAIELSRFSRKDSIQPLFGVVMLANPLRRPVELFARFRIRSMWDDAESLKLLVHDIENLILPRLRAVRSFQDFAAFTTDERVLPCPIYDYPEEGFIYRVIIGDFEGAVAWGRERIFLDQPPREPIDETDRLWLRRLQIHKNLRRLLDQGDRAGVADVLRGWERAMLEINGIEHLWEDTPFPFEMG